MILVLTRWPQCWHHFSSIVGCSLCHDINVNYGYLEDTKLHIAQMVCRKKNLWWQSAHHIFSLSLQTVSLIIASFSEASFNQASKASFIAQTMLYDKDCNTGFWKIPPLPALSWCPFGLLGTCLAVYTITSRVLFFLYFFERMMKAM